MIKRYAIILALALPALSQTLNNATVDFTLFGITKPVTMGSTPPASCQDGQLYFDTSKPTGSNLSACLAGVWNPVGSPLPALSAVALSGSYADLLNKPTLSAIAISGAYSDLAGSPTLSTVATTGSYTDLSGRPTLATVASSGSYTDLSGRPVFATVASSGSYADLLNKPTIPTNTTQLTNGAGFLGPTSNAASASRLLSTPAQCASGRYSGGIQTSGATNCFQVQYSQIAGVPPAYVLPVANTTSLGGIIDGTGVNVSSTGVLTINYGTTNTTAAAGNDGRITGAAQKALNLSDLSSVTTALLNLRLTGATPTTIASSTTGNAATATALRGTGALRLKGLCGTAPTLATGQVGLWLDTADCNMHLQDLLGNQSVMVRTSIAGVDQGCTPGFAMTDISPAGVPVCTALPVPPPPPPSLAGLLCPAGNVVAGVDAASRLVCTLLPVIPPPPTGITASGSSCTITSISNGVITGATCAP